MATSKNNTSSNNVYTVANLSAKEYAARIYDVLQQNLDEDSALQGVFEYAFKLLETKIDADLEKAYQAGLANRVYRP